MSRDHILVSSGPRGGAVMEGVLWRIVGPALQRTVSTDENNWIAARIVGESMRAVNIKVISSSDIGGFFPVNGKFICRHEKCSLTFQESWSCFIIKEDVRNICGEHSIVLYYD
jgi:hypothetical protein